MSVAAFAACSCSGDASSLSQENRALKAQLDRLMAERNDLRSQVGGNISNIGARMHFWHPASVM